MKHLLSRTILSIAVLALLAVNARAQATKSQQIVSLFRPVVARSSESTVRVLAGGKDAALGVIVSADGWILSKFSELKGKKIKCKLPGGKEVEAEMFGHDDPFDLVLLKVEAEDLKPIEWTDSKVSRLGHWVASVGPGQDPVAIGVVSVLARKVKGAKYSAPAGGQGGFLGIALDQEFAGVKILEIVPNMPAAKAGFKADDLILSVDGKEVQDSEEFQALIGRHKAGESVTLKFVREEKEMEKTVTLGERPGSAGGKSKGDVQNNMGSKLSDRKAGFPVILQHDSVVKPHECGGPLVNLDGKVIGINICRAGRTESYAIPSEEVRPLLERLKAVNTKKELKQP